MKMSNKKSYLLAGILISTMSFLNAQSESQEADNFIKKSQEALIAKNYVDASKSLQKAKEEVTKLLSNQLASCLPAKFDNWLPVNDSKASNSPGMPVGMGMGIAGSSDMSCTRIYELGQNTDAKKGIITPPSVVPPVGLPVVPPAGLPVVPPPVPVGMPPAMPNSIPPATPVGVPPAMPPGTGMSAMTMEFEKPKIIVTISNNASIAANIAFINSGNNSNSMMAGPAGIADDTKAMKIKNYRAMSKSNKQMKSCEIDIIVGAGVVQIQGNNIENIDMLQRFADMIDYLKIKSVFGE